MEFDLQSNNADQNLLDWSFNNADQNLLDWSFIGDPMLIPDISQLLSDVDGLAPLPESTIDPYYDQNLPSLYPTSASDLTAVDIFPWNDNYVTLTNTGILDPMLPNISDEISPPNCFISNNIFPWNMNSVTLLNNETFAIVPPAFDSNIANRVMDISEDLSNANQLHLAYKMNKNNNMRELERGVIERRETGRSRLANISHAEMKKYFSIPITSAAKELNVGLTILKKRCRELGIPRWPHRKIKSLKSLISNVQELGKECSMERLSSELEMLETHKKLMEDNPEVELTERTKKLRQACFKANYKKRRARSAPFSYDI